MNRKWIFVLVLALMGSMAMAQDSDRKLLSDPALQHIDALKTLADEIGQQEAVLPTLTRNGAAAAEEKLHTLYVSYNRELQNQRKAHASETATVTAIDAELKLVATKK